MAKKKKKKLIPLLFNYFLSLPSSLSSPSLSSPSHSLYLSYVSSSFISPILRTQNHWTWNSSAPFQIPNNRKKGKKKKITERKEKKKKSTDSSFFSFLFSVLARHSVSIKLQHTMTTAVSKQENAEENKMMIIISSSTKISLC